MVLVGGRGSTFIEHAVHRGGSGDATSLSCLQEMERPPRKVTFFPVVDDARLVGLVTLHGLVSAGL